MKHKAVTIYGFLAVLAAAGLMFTITASQSNSGVCVFIAGN